VCTVSVVFIVSVQVNVNLLDRVSKNVPPMACYNFDTHEQSVIFFGRNVTEKVGYQKVL